MGLGNVGLCRLHGHLLRRVFLRLVLLLCRFRPELLGKAGRQRAVIQHVSPIFQAHSGLTHDRHEAFHNCPSALFLIWSRRAVVHDHVILARSRFGCQRHIFGQSFANQPNKPTSRGNVIPQKRQNDFTLLLSVKPQAIEVYGKRRHAGLLALIFQHPGLLPISHAHQLKRHAGRVPDGADCELRQLHQCCGHLHLWLGLDFALRQSPIPDHHRAISRCPSFLECLRILDRPRLIHHPALGVAVDNVERLRKPLIRVFLRVHHHPQQAVKPLLLAVIVAGNRLERAAILARLVLQQDTRLAKKRLLPDIPRHGPVRNSDIDRHDLGQLVPISLGHFLAFAVLRVNILDRPDTLTPLGLNHSHRAAGCFPTALAARLVLIADQLQVFFALVLIGADPVCIKVCKVSFREHVFCFGNRDGPHSRHAGRVLQSLAMRMGIPAHFQRVNPNHAGRAVCVRRVVKERFRPSKTADQRILEGLAFLIFCVRLVPEPFRPSCKDFIGLGIANLAGDEPNLSPIVDLRP